MSVQTTSSRCCNLFSLASSMDLFGFGKGWGWDHMITQGSKTCIPGISVYLYIVYIYIYTVPPQANTCFYRFQPFLLCFHVYYYFCCSFFKEWGSAIDVYIYIIHLYRYRIYPPPSNPRKWRFRLGSVPWPKDVIMSCWWWRSSFWGGTLIYIYIYMYVT